MIIELLRENARRSLTEIASLVGISRPTVNAHIDRLLTAGIITRFTIDVGLAIYQSANVVVLCVTKRKKKVIEQTNKQTNMFAIKMQIYLFDNDD